MPGVLVAPERLKAKSAQLQLDDPDSLLERRVALMLLHRKGAKPQLWPSCFQRKFNLFRAASALGVLQTLSVLLTLTRRYFIETSSLCGAKTISTRRFNWRPADVSLLAVGLSGPKERVLSRSVGTPRSVSAACTALARRCARS